MPLGSEKVLSVKGLGDLLQTLREEGFTLVGPRVRDGAIVHDEILGIEDLPRGTVIAL
jgi:hypothetical protein